VAAQPTTNTNQETSTIVNNSDNTNNQIVTNIPNIMSFENTSFNDFFDPFF
jgi:hypothetical protein